MNAWPKDLLEQCQVIDAAASDGVDRDRRLRAIIREAGLDDPSLSVPDFPSELVRALAGDNEGHASAKRLSRLIWSVRWEAIGGPSLIETLVRGEWASRNGTRQEDAENQAITGGFSWRAYVENFAHAPIPDEFYEASAQAQLYAALFQAGRLRASFKFAELVHWTEDQRLPDQVRSNSVMRALSLLGRMGSRKTTDVELLQLEDLWTEGNDQTRDLLVHALFLARPFDQQGELLAAKARDYFVQNPSSRSTVIKYYLARGYRLQGKYEEAYASIIEALAGLRSSDTTSSVEQLQEQYSREREMIIFKRETDQMRGDLRSYLSRLNGIEQHLGQVEESVVVRSREAEQRLVDLAHGSTVRTTEVVGLFVAAITFALGSVSLLNGWQGPGLVDRLVVLMSFGVVMTLFTCIGIWLIGRQMGTARAESMPDEHPQRGPTS